MILNIHYTLFQDNKLIASFGFLPDVLYLMRDMANRDIFSSFELRCKNSYGDDFVLYRVRPYVDGQHSLCKKFDVRCEHCINNILDRSVFNV